MMKRHMLLMIAVLCLAGITQADVTAVVDPAATWSGYMNVFETPANGGVYLWGSAWGTADLPANFTGAGLVLGANTNVWNTEDAYWVDPVTGLGNKTMEANFYQEWYGGLAGQTVTFNYNVLGNDLAAAGYTTQAFIKVLDPDSGWATIQSTFTDLTPGSNTLTLTVDSIATPVTQVGFVVMGINVDPASAEAALAVTIEAIPEPATLALLGLGGLLIRRKK